jgi:DNA-binding Xre family transcriptional regulator
MPGITIQITGEGAGAAEALRVIEERMQQTAKRGSEMSEQLATAGRTIQEAFGAIGIGFGLAQAISGLKGMIETSMQLGVEIGHLSQQTGISTENLSVLKYMSDQTGVSFESLTKGFKKLSTDLEGVEHGTKASKQAFSDTGITQKELTATGGDLYKVMELVADKFKEMPDGYKKNAAASELFGKAGQQLIPILNGGSEGIAAFKAEAEQLGLVLDEKGVQKMEDLHRSTEKLKGAFEGLSLELTSSLAPALESLMKLTPQVFGFGGQGAHGSDFAAGLQSIADKAHGAVLWLEKLGYLQQGNFSAAAKIDSDDAARQRAAWDAGQAHPDASKPKPAPGIKPDSTAGIKAANKQEMEDAAIERQSQEMFQKDLEDANRRVAAKLRITEAGETAELAIAKSGASLRLAQLNSEHQVGLVTEANYLREKLALAQRENDEETAALREKQSTLQTSIAREGSSETVRKMELEAQLVAVEAKLTELSNARLATEAQITGEIQQQSWQKEVQAARLAIEESHRQEQRDAPIANLMHRSDDQHENLNVEASRQAASTVGNFMDQLTAQAVQGRISFKSLVDSAVMDLERFAMKVMEQRMLMPILNSLFGLGDGGAAATLAGAMGVTASSAGIQTSSLQLPFLAGGGDISSGMAVVGDGGDGSGSEIFAPKGPGTVLPHDVLEGIAKGGGSGSGGPPNVTIHNVNQSSQAVEMKQSGVSYDAQARQFIIHTILEDAASGGPVAGMLSGMGRG